MPLKVKKQKTNTKNSTKPNQTKNSHAQQGYSYHSMVREFPLRHLQKRLMTSI